MSKIDYQELGLIVGLEVHQQLGTDHKMFCRCPAGVYTKEHDGEIIRHMRPTLSELGGYDGTALMEFKTKKNILYLLHKSNVCTYEMDDTPPFLVNQKALDTAIEQCLMLGCDIVDEVHVARKQYLDGSIPTGFQRTAIVGVNGKLPFRGRELTVLQVSVEEDSCREVSDTGHLIVWRTDRLGMPLIETVTGPDLHTPDEVVEAILLVGRVCRNTGHVRTGIGASRQDINVSVRGGKRVEIKGVPKAGWARKLVHGEAVRQKNLLELKKELSNRGFNKPEDFNISHEDVTYIFTDSSLQFLRKEHWKKRASEAMLPELSIGEGDFSVRAIKLSNLAGTLSWPTQPDKTFAHELAGRVRVIACLDEQPILIHSENWAQFHGAQDEFDLLKKQLSLGKNDATVIVWGALKDTITAANEIQLRYVDALDGVPNETRQPFADGSTDFERILPGPDRMYPDTDSPPIEVTPQRVVDIKNNLPDPPWVREERYLKVGIPVHTAHYLIRRNGAALVDVVNKSLGADLRQACFLFGEKLKGLSRDYITVPRIPTEKWCEFFQLVKENPAIFDLWKSFAVRMARNPKKAVSKLADEILPKTVVSNWQAELTTVIADVLKTWKKGDGKKQIAHIMGLVMPKLRGLVPSKTVAEAIESTLKK